MNAMPPDLIQFFRQLLADPPKLVGFLTGLIALLAMLFKSTRTLIRWMRTWRDRRTLRKRLGAELYYPQEIIQATTNYIRPNCQSIDPSGGEDMRKVYAVQEDLFNAIDRLLASSWEHKYLILLADSGMGKTSFLLNYYAKYWWSWRKRRRFDLAIVPLGIANADDHIKQIANKENTVLFLDAFDEDTRTQADYQMRLVQLLNICQPFRQTLITCRTQFFRKDDEIPLVTGQLKVGTTKAGEFKEHFFYKLYLAPFSEKQVRTYVKRNFPIWKFPSRLRALQVIKQIPDLSVRPMLLAHLRDLIRTGRDFQYSFQIYEEMVNAWLIREQYFVKNKNTLLSFSERLAVDLYVNREKRGAERIVGTELLPLAQEWKINLEDWQLRGRSLLNRDATGNYKFAHRSIMEYLFVKKVTTNDPQYLRTNRTDQMNIFLIEIIKAKLPESKYYLIPRVDEFSKCLPFIKLRAKAHGSFSIKDAEKTIREWGFFDSGKNKVGNGLFHLYEQIIERNEHTIVDHATGLIWQQAGSSDRLNYTDAEAYVYKLNNQKFAGYNDWRLPTLEEAMSLIEPTTKHGDLYIDPVFDKTQNFIWTADKPLIDCVWHVSFFSGVCSFYDVKNRTNHVRAVRSGQSSGI